MDNERLVALEAHYNAIIPTLATKADVAALRAEIQGWISDTHKWMVGTIIGLFIGFAGLFIGMGQVLTRAPPLAPAATYATAPQAPAPVIIYLPQPQQQPSK
jgi:hypothetical protein